jgi:hypothetical protein
MVQSLQSRHQVLKKFDQRVPIVLIKCINPRRREAATMCSSMLRATTTRPGYRGRKRMGVNLSRNLQESLSERRYFFQQLSNQRSWDRECCSMCMFPTDTKVTEYFAVSIFSAVFEGGPFFTASHSSSLQIHSHVGALADLIPSISAR